MKKIAIVAASFAPFNTISSIRPTKMAKYLKKNENYDITVICKSVPPEKSDELLKKDLIYVDRFVNVDIDVDTAFPKLEKLLEDIKAKRSKKHCEKVKNAENKTNLSNESKYSKKGFLKAFRKVTKGLIRNIKMLIFVIKNYIYAKEMKKQIRKNGVGNFDFIFSTYGPLSGHLIGKYLKKKNPKAVWIADFRDYVYSDTSPKLFASHFYRYKKHIVKRADKLTAISQGVLDSLELPKNKPSKVITNGFDRGDIQGIQFSPHNDGKLHLTYAGFIYKDKRDFTTLFSAIKELAKAGHIDINKIVVDYAGSTFEEIYHQAKSVDAQGLLVNHGLLKRDDSLRLQLKSDVLLLASWNMPGNTGILTGKLFEYMMMGKPIISIISGSVPNSAIKEFTNRCSLGFCYEHANYNNDYRQLKEYILEIYNDFIKTSKVSDPRNMAEIEKYDYKNLAKELKTLMN